MGTACGIPLAVAFARLISSQLYGISPYDPWAVSVSIAVLVSVSTIASFIPARRATKVDPMVALRYE
jgi:ABC-type antimicrobial peptide transport system permease subunit